MPYRIALHHPDGTVTEHEAHGGEDIRFFLAGLDIFIDSPCGGHGHCGKCMVTIGPIMEEVLSCKTKIDRDLEIYLPGAMEMEIAGHTAAAPESREHSGKLGVAVDVGTTTVVAHLTDLVTGKRLATSAGVNAQRTHGADVVSRIEYSAEFGHEGLTRLIRTQINGMVADACGKAGAQSGDIVYIVIAGNTIMEHLVADYSPAGMGTVPFTPVSLFGCELPPWEGLPVSADAKVYYAPCVSSYVGGDITAGFLACGLESDSGPTIFIDIGTNGEITMKKGGEYLCCATAAGPAFEGAEIECGMAAVPGAVSRVKLVGDKLEIGVIGDKTPEGICGSGLLDALAVMLDTGAADETGRLLGADEAGGLAKPYIGVRGGKNVFYLSREDEVYVSAADVRKLQLAKAAIAGGIQTLLRTSGISNSDVRTFILAGGFGSYMDKNSAVRIGLYPREFLSITRGEGNTAGEGAAIALLSAESRGVLESAWRRCEYLELSSSAIFNEEFVENMMFE